VSPYVGVRVAANTTILGGREGAETDKFTFGSSVGFLTEGVLGVEADMSFVPSFFEGGVVTRSAGVSTLMANLMVATPLAVAQYGLRPYAVGGVGLIHAGGGADVLGPLFDSNLFGINIGGGALGPISDRTSLRFDVRYFRNIGTDDAVTATSTSGVKLSFWRATAGLSFRF
jgi:hypothetical protein